MKKYSWHKINGKIRVNVTCVISHKKLAYIVLHTLMVKDIISCYLEERKVDVNVVKTLFLWI